MHDDQCIDHPGLCAGVLTLQSLMPRRIEGRAHGDYLRDQYRAVLPYLMARSEAEPPADTVKGRGAQASQMARIGYMLFQTGKPDDARAWLGRGVTRLGA